MLEPTTFPKAKSEAPLNAALILTINSGADVANETTVIPITILGISSFNESATADFNNQFPPKINKSNPPAINKKFIKIFFAKIRIYNFLIFLNKMFTDQF